MYLKDFLTGLRRRWYLAVVGLLITAGLGLAVVTVVPPSYTSTTSMLLLPPQQGLGARGNPYLNLTGLGQALEVLSTRINASEQVAQITEEHPDLELSIGQDTTSTGPILLISVTGATGTEATEVRDELTELAPITLVSMQAELNIAVNSRITIATLASDPEPEQNRRDQLRGLIAVLAVGIAATVLVTGYLDFLLARRRESRGIVASAQTPVPTRAATRSIRKSGASATPAAGTERTDSADWWDGSEAAEGDSARSRDEARSTSEDAGRS